MVSLLGNLLLTTSLVFALLTIALRQRTKIICFYVASILPGLALSLLVYAFLTSDFSLKNVFFNSSSLLPTIYKVSACWASHEGSILLWYSLLCLMSFLYIFTAKFSEKSKELGATILAFIQILFCSFIIFTSSPFDPLSFKPEQGLGLTPMLQDIALAIHPPLLYLGFVSFVASFTGGILLLFNPKEKKELFLSNAPFLNFGLAALTSGIGLGAWWAYRELGWGGYWFFDPVENISLLPWISGICLHHYTLLSTRKNQYLSWTIFLSILSFLLTIYGTFIVRSGMISSVHSFSFSPERGFYIFSICIILTVLSLGVFVWKKNLLNHPPSKNNLQSKMILIGNAFWLLSLFTLVISLLYPIYCSLVKGVDVVIDPEYFKKIYIPIHIPILVLAAISPSLFISSNKKKYLIFFISIFISSIVSWWINVTILPQAFFFCSIYLILQTISHLLAISSGFSKSIPQRSLSLFLGHFGFGLLVLSITLNTTLSQEIEFVGKKGTKIESNGFVVKLENIKSANGENYYRQIAEFSIEYLDNITILKPENRLYKVENSLSQEVDLYSFLFHDIYAVLNQVSKKQTVSAKIYYHPFISFIWISVILMSIGFLLLLLRKPPLHDNSSTSDLGLR